MSLKYGENVQFDNMIINDYNNKFNNNKEEIISFLSNKIERNTNSYNDFIKDYEKLGIYIESAFSDMINIIAYDSCILEYFKIK